MIRAPAAISHSPAHRRIGRRRVGRARRQSGERTASCAIARLRRPLGRRHRPDRLRCGGRRGSIDRPRVAVALPSTDASNCHFVPARFTTSTGRDSTSAFSPCTAERARMAGCSGSSRTGGFPFTGPGSASARLAMSKTATKAALRPRACRRRPTPRSTPIRRWRCCAERAEAMRLGYPVVVKPDGQGSSLGVGLARNRDELAACRDAVLRFDDRGFDRAVCRRGANSRWRSSVVKFCRWWKSWRAGRCFRMRDKYTPGEPHCRVVDDLPHDQALAIRDAASAAAVALDTRGWCASTCGSMREGGPGFWSSTPFRA